jgi:hypothetical protein
MWRPALKRSIIYRVSYVALHTLAIINISPSIRFLLEASRRGKCTDEGAAQHAAGELACISKRLEEQCTMACKADGEGSDGLHQAPPRIGPAGRRVAPRQRHVAALATHVLRNYPRQRLQPAANFQCWNSLPGGGFYYLAVLT